ncbi:hypothetical protein ACHAXS_001801 [Conticribra weissflogii]
MKNVLYGNTISFSRSGQNPQKVFKFCMDNWMYYGYDGIKSDSFVANPAETGDEVLICLAENEAKELPIAKG